MSIRIACFTLKYNTGAYFVPNLKPTLFILLCILLPFLSIAKGEDNPDEEISITIEVKNVGTLDVPAIYHNKEVYLSVTHVFDFIKVRNRPSPSFDSVSGFFLQEKDVFLIDESNNQILFREKTYTLNPSDLIRSETDLYMNLKDFKAVFGLDGVFNFRRLWVTFSTNDELPVVREMRQEQLRKNISRLNGDQKADTTIKRTFPLFHLGMADWSVMSTQQSESYDDTRFNVGLGAVVLGGETDVSLNYYNKQPFSELQQYYQWRYVNNDLSALRQVSAGKIFTQGIASLYARVVGVQFSNAPTNNRQSYGTYTISDKAEPGWIVELYVNEILVAYKRTDASGFYTFDVPIVYGNTVVKLCFYGPYGEVRTSRRYLNIPFNFLPIHQFEYTASGGIVEDGQNSKFSRIATNYGLSGHITIGAGVEYLSSVTSGPAMPFATTSLRLGSRLLLSGEYTYGVRSRGILSYRLPNGIQLDLDYIKYAAGQTAIYYNYLEERKAVISIPTHGTGFTLFSRLSLDQITVPLSRYTNAELAFTGSIRTVGLNLTTYASFADHDYNPYFYSLFSASCVLPKKFNLTGQVEYDYKLNKVAFMKYTIEKYLFGKGYINLSYQEFFTGNTENFTGNYQNILVGLRYDLSFVRVSVSALAANNGTYSRVETASGSFIYDAKSDYFKARNTNNVGKAGIVVEPFLDVNCNGKWDEGEPKADGLKIRINGGRIIYGKDTAIRVFDLEPYTSYYIDLSSNSFDNIAWQLKNHSIKVTVDANDFTLVEVPVAVVGEVSGIVSFKNKDGKKIKSQGQITVSIYNSDSILVAHTQTESDGFFDYVGLAPGSYIARVDPVQLQKLHMNTKPIPFQIRTTKNNEGDVANGVVIVLQQQE